MYVALNYIRNRNKIVSPGEVFEDMDADTAARYLAKGAIREISADAENPVAPAADITEPKESEPENAEPETETEDAEEVEEPEIDALEGVITSPKEEEQPKAKKTSGRAKGGKAK